MDILMRGVHSAEVLSSGNLKKVSTASEHELKKKGPIHSLL